MPSYVDVIKDKYLAYPFVKVNCQATQYSFDYLKSELTFGCGFNWDPKAETDRIVAIDLAHEIGHFVHCSSTREIMHIDYDTVSPRLLPMMHKIAVESFVCSVQVSILNDLYIPYTLLDEVIMPSVNNFGGREREIAVMGERVRPMPIGMILEDIGEKMGKLETLYKITVLDVSKQIR